MARVVVVSGGGTGIGRAVARRFREEGDEVVIVGRRAEVLDLAAKEMDAVPVVADLAEPEGALCVADEVERRYGRVDVLVNNAGGNAELRLPDGLPQGDGRSRAVAWTAWHWTANFRANVLTAALLTEALRDLLSRDSRVVLVSSIAAMRGSGSGSYAAAKAALHPYAIDLAGSLGRLGATVNVVAPGFIDETEFFAGRMTDERRATLVGQTLNGRAGSVEDIAATVLWLASPAAGHVTGQIIQVNGGAVAGR
ncbi:SDR family NAD(P)-dependent oxidoreductase [Dactylosporangium sp. NPDC048998]|uniref:SDR family NAD(P)-dependent oxidoreductase n=1 Tax=Dactylosporangium sp. NPDC048998 TaxID=3363976 RepID=UPI003721DEB2